MKILEELWYGNVDPMEYDTSSCKEYKEVVQLIFKNEEQLRKTMTDEQKGLFEKYTDCVRELQTINDCLLFQSSFKLGARLMLEVMEDWNMNDESAISEWCLRNYPDSDRYLQTVFDLCRKNKINWRKLRKKIGSSL